MAGSDRQRALEAALREAPDDVAVLQVYADWLISRDDPRGKLIVLQHQAELAAETQRSELEGAAAAHVEEHAAALLGPVAKLPGATVTWRRGFFSSLRLRGPAVAAAAASLEHPSAAFLVKLSLDPVDIATVAALLDHPAIDRLARLELLVEGWHDTEVVVDALAARPRPQLASLVLGVANVHARAKVGSFVEAWDVTNGEGGLVASESVQALVAATPALRELELHGDRLFPGLEHPTLTQLKLVGDALNGCIWDTVEGVVVLPCLERLEQILLPDEYRHLDVTPPVLFPDRMPALREIAISGDYGDNTETTLFGAFAGSAILPQLVSLSITNLKSRPDGDGAHLEALAPYFHHLHELHVDVIQIDGDGDDGFEARCRRALPNLRFDRVKKQSR